MESAITLNILIGIASSVAGAIIYAGGIWALKVRSEMRGAYTGQWRGEILDAQGNVEKIDIYSFKHRGDIIQGDIERVSPNDQMHRRWKMYGRLRGRDLFSIFWSTDPKVLSYGCCYLHQVSDFEFQGYYLRITESKSGVAVNPIPLRLHKESK